jgi:hypothetical protein
MKIGGIEVTGPAEEVLVLPRLDGDIIFRAKAVTGMEEFEKLCPEPKAKPVLKAGGWKDNVDDPDYKAQMERYGANRWHYIVLKSLEPSEIEWATVDLGNPETWENWQKELIEAHFSSVEINRITVCVMQANSLDERKLEAARESFLRGPEGTAEKSSGPVTAQPNTPSGEPANVKA